MERPRERELQGHCVTLTILRTEPTKPTIIDPVFTVIISPLKNIPYPKLYRHFLFLETFSAFMEKSNPFSFFFFLLLVIIKVVNAHF